MKRQRSFPPHTDSQTNKLTKPNRILLKMCVSGSSNGDEKSKTNAIFGVSIQKLLKTHNSSKRANIYFILLTSVIYGLFELFTKLPKIFNE